MSVMEDAARLIPEKELGRAIWSMEQQLDLLKWERKDLGRKIIANRQRQAEIRNVLKALRERKKGVK